MYLGVNQCAFYCYIDVLKYIHNMPIIFIVLLFSRYAALTLVYFTNIILGQKVFYIPQIISSFLHIMPDGRLDMCFGHLCPTAHTLPLKVLLIQVRNLLGFKIAEDPN